MILDVELKARLSRKLTLLLIFALVILFAITQLTAEQGHLARWLIQSLPLLVFVRGIHNKRPRSGIWLCFVLLLYFLVVTVNLSAPGDVVKESVTMSLIVSLFISSMMFSRWQAIQFSEMESTQNGTATHSG